MRHRTICAALAILAASTAMAAAEPVQFVQAGPPGLPPYEVVTIVRSTGLDPLGHPMRRGGRYVLRAVDEADREVRVVVHARSGEILSVTPVVTASRMPPGGAYDRPAPRYVPADPYPRGAYEVEPPVDDDEDDVVDAPRPPAAVPGAAPPRTSSAAPPPASLSPSQGRVESRSLGPPPAEPHVITATVPGRNGVLPPPPERFPQRVAPPPAVKPAPAPVRRTASVPKQAPLPKPKPVQAAPAAEPAAPPPAAIEKTPDTPAIPN